MNSINFNGFINLLFDSEAYSNENYIKTLLTLLNFIGKEKKDREKLNENRFN